MLIVPVSHENLRGRRWPVVTGTIVVLSLLSSLAFWSLQGRGEERARQATDRAAEYWRAHPHLSAPKTLGLRGPLAPSLLGELARERPRPPELLAEEQAEMDRLVAAADAAAREQPVYRLGWVASERNALGLFAHMFLHGGVLHLLGNLWFLWLCGCNLEDRWGRAVFPAFYLGAGLAAALLHAALVADGTVPMIGASGAIAGAMGGFLVIHARTRIRFFYLYWLALVPRWGTFWAPAWVMLPLWLAVELFWALVGVGSGVAHWAHVGGFVFGLVGAAALRLTGLDGKLDSAVESAVSMVQDPRLAAASGHIDAGRHGEALALLDALASEMPASIDVQLETLRAAGQIRDEDRSRRAYARLVPLYMKAGDAKVALRLFQEARQRGLDGAISPADRLRVAREFEALSDLTPAAETYAGLYAGGFRDALAVNGALSHGRLEALCGRWSEAARIFDAVAQAPSVPPEERLKAREELARMRQVLAELDPQPGGGAELIPVPDEDQLIPVPDETAQPLMDVLVTSVPAMTPDGEPFVPALARAFGVDVPVAERIAQKAPLVVKRLVTADIAEAMKASLVSLGARAEIVPRVDLGAPPSGPAPKASSGLSLPPRPPPPAAPGKLP